MKALSKKIVISILSILTFVCGVACFSMLNIKKTSIANAEAYSDVVEIAPNGYVDLWENLDLGAELGQYILEFDSNSTDDFTLGITVNTGNTRLFTIKKSVALGNGLTVTDNGDGWNHYVYDYSTLMANYGNDTSYYNPTLADFYMTGLRNYGAANTLTIANVEFYKNITYITLDAIGHGGWNNVDNSFNGAVPDGVTWTLLNFSLPNDDFTPDATNLITDANSLSLGVKLNGKTFYELYQENNQFAINTLLGYFQFQIPKTYLVGGNGYTLPTIEIAEGTLFKGYSLPQVEMELRDGTWQEPAKYDDLAFTGFLGDDFNNKDFGALSVFLTFDASNFAPGAQIFPESVSGIKLNGVELPKNQFILWEANRLWIQYTAEDVVANVNGYSHPTIEFVNATVSNATNTYTFNNFAIYLNLDTQLWQTEKPEGYSTTTETGITGIGSNNCTLVGSNYVSDIEFSVDLSGCEASAFDSLVKFNGNSVAAVGGTLSIAGNCLKVSIPNTVEIANGATLAVEGGNVNGYIFSASLVYKYFNGYFIGDYDIGTPNITLDAIGHGGWNNVDNTYNTVIPEGATWTLLNFSLPNDDFTPDATNLITEANSLSLSATLNGKTFYELYKENNQFAINVFLGYFQFQIPKTYLVGGNGYELPTIEIAEGTPFKGQYLPQVNMELRDGIWQEPAKYDDLAFTGFLGDDFNNKDFGTPSVFLTFEASDFATDAQANPVSVSGIKLNGVELSKNKLVLWDTNRLWIQYTAEDAVADVNGYSHPTIEFKNATLSNATNTYTFNDLTIYLNLDTQLWQTEKPEGYVIYKSTTLEGIDVTSAQQAIVLNYADSFTGADGTSALEAAIILGDNTTLAQDGGSVTIDAENNRITIATVGAYNKIMISGDVRVGSIILPSDVFYYWEGAWHTNYKAKLANIGVSGWNNVDSSYNTAIPEGTTWTIISLYDFDNKGLKFDSSKVNLLEDEEFARRISLNGVSLYDLMGDNQLLVVNTLMGYLQFQTPKDLLVSNNEYKVPTIKISAGAEIGDVILPELEIILFKGAWLESDALNMTPFEYNGIAGGWNNVTNGTFKDTILTYGKFVLENGDSGAYVGDYLNSKAEDGNVSHNDTSNLATGVSGEEITLNGIKIKDIPGLVLSYAHGYCYVYFSIPEFALVPNDEYPVTTLHIPQDTIFMTSLLNEVTLYLVDGAWTTEKPAVVEGVDDSYITIGDITENSELLLDGDESFEAQIPSGDIVFKYLFSATEKNLNYTISLLDDNNNVIKIRVTAVSENNKLYQKVALLFNADELDSGKIAFTTDELYAYRIALTSVDNQLRIVVSVDGVILVDELIDDLEAGANLKIQTGKAGTYSFKDFKAGDIKKPIINWQGKSTYTFKHGEEKPDDTLFIGSLYASDNVDFDGISYETATVEWQNGAIVDGKLQKGEWTVTISISDSSNNIARMTVLAVVSNDMQFMVYFGDAEGQVYNKGDLIERPTDPIKEEDEYGTYVFDGWYFNDRKWDFANDIVLEDVYLEARFINVKSKQFTITLVSEGLENNYQYDFKFNYTEENIISNIKLIIEEVEGYEYKLYNGSTLINSITVEKDMTIRVVYTEIVNQPNEPDTPNGSDAPDNSSNNEGNKDADDSKSGCFGTVNTNVALIFIAFAGMVVLKGLLRKGGKENE